jgi:hypothetical protein
MFHRIQKLLSSEYSNFYENILVESPFAQLSSHMRGIRAVQIALTERNLIIASDTFLHKGIVLTGNHLDADIETLELLQIIPLKLLRIKLTRKGLHDRFYMKLIIKKNPKRIWKVFEFGGHAMKHFFWDVWNDKLHEMREREEMFVNSSVENLKVLKMFSSESFKENDSELESITQESSKSQESSSVQEKSSKLSLRESLKNLLIDDNAAQCTAANEKIKSFKETKL